VEELKKKKGERKKGRMERKEKGKEKEKGNMERKEKGRGKEGGERAGHTHTSSLSVASHAS
jgi:hypothetical protein